MRKQQKKFLRQRQEKLQDLLKTKSCDAIVIEDPFLLYYLTGVHITTGRFIATQGGVKLFVDARYTLKCKEADTVSVGLWGSEAAFMEKCRTVGFDADKTTYSQYKVWKDQYALVPLDLGEIRAVKDTYEIACMQQSAVLLKRGLRHVTRLLKPGITETELAFKFEMYCRKLGAEGLAFPSIIAFGSGSAQPHYSPDQTRLKSNDWVLVDAGLVYKGYCSDMTRTYAVGKPKTELLRIKEAVVEAQKMGIQQCFSGNTVGSVCEAVDAVLEKKGYLKYFTHSLGHGIGLEVHEGMSLRRTEPHSHVVLKEGMVVTIEPGVYIQGVGGVRHEDMVLVTHSGCRVL